MSIKEGDQVDISIIKKTPLGFIVSINNSEDGLIYENDILFDDRNLTNGNNTVTVGNFYECKSYVEGGYYSQSSEIFLNNSENEKRIIFNKLILFAGFLSVLCYIVMIIFRKDLIKVDWKNY